jgi:predicted porin
MKKTLIALAVVAVSGTAFAQSAVTLSGGVAYGYQSVTASNVTNKGFGMDTAAIKLTATEDLGGGLKATGVISAGGLARGNAVTGEDMSLTLAGGFGSLLMGQIEIGSGIRGLAQAGAPVNNMEGEVLAAATAGTDIVKYTAPAMGGITFSGSLTEAKNLATGLDTATKGTSAVTVGAAYSNGPLSASIDTSSWNSASTAVDNRYRVSASYDLGMAKVGAGLESQKLVAGGTNKYTMVGVSAPLGAVTVGAAMVTSDASATAGSKSGSTFGASYALSKRTSLTANYATWEVSEAAGAAKDKKTTILLAHSF